MFAKVKNFMKANKMDLLFLAGLGIISLATTIPGIVWGAPDIWNPDEIVRQVAFSIDQSPVFDRWNLIYPDLPQYIMLAIGKILFSLGQGPYSVIIVSRLFSAFLGIMIVWITYMIARKVTSGRFFSIMASLFVVLNMEFVINSRFAHNDMYLVFFLMLSVFSLFQYQEKKKIFWFYGSFMMIGFAAASKYNGGSLILAPVLIYLLNVVSWTRNSFLYHIRVLFLGGLSAFTAFCVGNPIIFVNPVRYFGELIPILRRHATYEIRPGDVIGFFGQWSELRVKTLGEWVYYLLIVALIFVVIRIFANYFKFGHWGDRKVKQVEILLAAIFVFDLPIMISYNYNSRFFLFLVPLFGILIVMFLEELMNYLNKYSRKFSLSFVVVIFMTVLVISGSRVISTVLLFYFDARIPATEYIAELPRGNSIEYTTYHPRIPEGRFFPDFDYPLVFIKWEDQELPVSNRYEFNTGEEGVESREPSYLIIDSIVSSRFDNSYVCDLHLQECEFFRNLFEGETNYVLIATFAYDLPSYLPQVQVAFTNPDIYIFQRVEP